MASKPARTELVSEFFVRGLAVVYAIAFASIGVQVIGLIGARGIMPAADFLAQARQVAPLGSLLSEVPSWFWMTGASDRALRGACIAGCALALLAAAGKWQRAALFAAWSLYLSLCTVGSVFFSYQWDALLLETGIVGLFVATRGSPIGLWLARALCFKLMWLSGFVKLRSGDTTWHDLSALSFHWWTQPLPAWPAVWASQLPRWMQSGMTLVTLVIELVAPFGIFGPRRARLAACAALALLQVAIASTGSYGFFNLLSLVLCASLLDDDALLALSPRALRGRLALSAQERARPLARAGQRVQLALACALLASSAAVAGQRILPLPAAVHAWLAALAPLRSVNSYGLFAMMTTERREIALEGSDDGVNWRGYRFRWKPGPLDEHPRFTPFHMPRLDWQLWFAALSRCERQPWLLEFQQRILQGSPDVLALLASNPFPSAPPRLLRTPTAAYRFAPGAGWWNGQWWVADPGPDYCPKLTLRNGRLARAL
jgi:hypothetical protein